MFQQFKNIFPTASINLRSLSESVGINDSDWNKGVERIGALRDEFNNMLLNRSESSDSISVNQQTDTETIPSITELQATSQLIHNLQNGWDEIHENNQRNFEKAKEADVKLRQLQSVGDLHYKVCEMMENSESDIKHINDNLAAIHEYAANLMDVLTSLEEKIDQVSVDYEKNQFELWKQNQEREILEEVAQKRQLLKEKENSYRQKYEEHEQTQRKKRVELYEANFNAELEDYRRRRENEVSSLYSNYSNRSLEEQSISTKLNQVKLVGGDDDLDDFLGEGESALKKEKPFSLKQSKTELPSTLKSKAKSTPKYADMSSSDEDDTRRVEILDDEDYEDM